MGAFLLHAQAWWDAQRFDQPVWQVAAWPEQKVRHIQLHVAKALGKVVAAYGEGVGVMSGTDALARVRDDVLLDVAISRSQLINLFPEVSTPPSLTHRRSCGFRWCRLRPRPPPAMRPGRRPRRRRRWRRRASEPARSSPRP